MDAEGSGALVMLILAIVVVSTLLYVAMLVIAAVVGLVACIGVGIGANLVVRALLGQLGDGVGPTPEVGRRAWWVMLLAPLPCLALGLLLAASMRDHGLAIGIWLGLLLISTPTYYYAWWGREKLPYLGWQPGNLPYKTDATMRAEEQIALATTQWQLQCEWGRLKTSWITFWDQLSL